MLMIFKKDWEDSRRWVDQGSCLNYDPDIFYPEPYGGGRGHSMERISATAIKVCGGCPVVKECDQWAEANGIEHGVWGGKYRLPKGTLSKRKYQSEYGRARRAKPSDSLTP